VCGAQQENVLWAVAATPTIGLDVMELEMTAFRAPATAFINKGASTTISRIHCAPDRGGNIA
jgi:hypothetical protein